MKSIPLNAVPAQTVSTTLADQVVGLRIYQLRTGLYMDVFKDGELVVGGVICENRNRIVRSAYFGFLGDFVWEDTQGSADPTYEGFGSRYFLYYLEAAEIADVLAG